jgi:hypothetical protein
MSKNSKLKVVHNKQEAIEEDKTQEVTQEKETSVQEDKENVKEQDPFKDATWFDQADLVIECSCGHITKLKHPGFVNIKTGLQLPFLYTISNELPGVPKLLSISCEKCNNKLTLKFVESENKEINIEEATIVKDEIENTTIDKESK